MSGKVHRDVKHDGGSQDDHSDKAWAIHAAIIGLNSGNLLFRGLELDQDNPETFDCYLPIYTCYCFTISGYFFPH